ncbi:unnamed protein product [Rotaria sp. Silwood1]|nr:unnamed protein product [Rotaria sp. Silwood1]CAF1516366.1 unnamed protein product [Rotaria sp. Silwood1]CAF3540963.1 unnamed protein product [Rotaria sp. Silwood1]CAF3585881.1 unnamed protein product [Rotaria sp. Silwood1]CAF3601730.1 unnamed protein product [Rotaria sp. Silwood1]
MFIIILGRWLLPKGNISHSALSQLLLVYLSLASDILDLLTLFGEKEIYLSLSMVHTVLIVFSLCMFQFALNLTATRGRSFYAEFDDTEIEIHQPVHPSSISKFVPAHHKILDKFIPGVSSTTRPLATTTTYQTVRVKPRASSICGFNPPDTIIENVDRSSDCEMKVNRNVIIPKPTFPEVDPPVYVPGQPMIHLPSISSLNSLHSSIWNTSRSKQTSRRSVADSMKVFVRKRSSKLLRSEIWSILVTLLLQDGPFFAIRLIAIIVYHVRSFLTYFFTFKNFLILIFQTYRIASICLEKDEQEKEFKEKVDTIRRMSLAATQLGVPLNKKI